MTRDMVIRILSRYDTNFGWEDGESIPAEAVVEAVEMAVEALKAQEPTKPLKRKNQNGFTYYHCAKCDTVLIAFQPKFCHKCGKAVKWE